MRSLFLVSFYGVLCGALWADRPSPEKYDADVRYLFVPVGFDSNDPDVMAVLDGVLPDTCYRLDKPDVERVGKTFSIRANMYLVSGNCLPFAVPFTQEVKLGRLGAADDYRIMTKNGSLTENLVVKEAGQTGIDDFNYASIDTVEVVRKGNAHIAVLKGPQTNNCLVIEKVSASTLNGKSVEVLPKIERLAQASDGTACRNVQDRFTAEVELPPLSLGRHLVHVRSAGGQAVNRVFTNLVSP